MRKHVLLFILIGSSLSSCEVFSELMTEPTYEIPTKPGETPPPIVTTPTSEPTTPADKPPAPELPDGPKVVKVRRNVTDYARKYLGTPYKYAGRTPRSGFDCSGFTSYVLNHHRIPVSNNSRAQAKEGRKVDLRKVKPGDLVFFKRKSGPIFHVALVVANSRSGIEVIHSTTSRGVIVENISQSRYWSPLIHTARDVIGR